MSEPGYRPVTALLLLVLLAMTIRVAGVSAGEPTAGSPPTHQSETGNLEIRIDHTRYSTPLLGVQLLLFPRTPGRNDLTVDLSRIDWRILDAEGHDIAPHGIAEQESPDWFNPSENGFSGRDIAMGSNDWKNGKIEVGGKKWHLKPGKYALEAVLDTSSDRPGHMGGDGQPLREIWIGKLTLPRVSFEVIGEVTDEALNAAAQKVRAAHPAGGEAMWQALAELVRPGMTIHQLQLALPTFKSARIDRTFVGQYGVLWTGGGFLMRYPLDDTWGVRASGCAIAPGAANGNPLAAVVTQPPQITARPEAVSGKSQINGPQKIAP